MELTVDSAGIEEAVAELAAVGARAADGSPVFEAVAADFHGIESKIFDSGAGGLWAPLAPATVAAKARAGQDPRILHATGALRASLTRRGAKWSRRVVRPDELVIGTRAPHAHLQTRRGVPARPALAITADDERRWVSHVEDYIATGRVPAGTLGL